MLTLYPNLQRAHPSHIFLVELPLQKQLLLSDAYHKINCVNYFPICPEYSYVPQNDIHCFESPHESNHSFHNQMQSHRLLHWQRIDFSGLEIHFLQFFLFPMMEFHSIIYHPQKLRHSNPLHKNKELAR